MLARVSDFPIFQAPRLMETFRISHLGIVVVIGVPFQSILS